MVAAAANVVWAFCVCRASCWQRPGKNGCSMCSQHPSPYQFTNPESWAGGLPPALPSWISCSREQHGGGSESTAASDSGFRGDRTSPSGFEPVTSWPSEEEPVGDSLSGQAILRELGTEVQRPRTDLGGSEDSLGLLVVSGWSPLLWGLFWSSVFVLCLPFWGLFLDFHLHVLWARKWGAAGWSWLHSLDYLLRCKHGREDLSPGEEYTRSSRVQTSWNYEHGLLWRVLLVHQGEDPRGDPMACGRGHRLLCWM